MTTTITNEHKKLNVPNLRFPEFQGEWEVESIKDVADFMGGGTPSSSNESFWQGTIPWISSSDIVENDIKNISISRYITEEAIAHSATKLCPAPSILIVSRVGVGKIALSKEAICTSQDFCNLINIKVEPIFLTYCLSQIMKRKSMEVQGTSIKGITTSEIQKISINIPSLQEQKKIGKILSLLDERIATQNKIIEDLKKLKSAIIDYVINSLNTDFAKFGSLYEMAGEGGTPTTSNASFYDNGKIPFIKIDDLKKKYLTENKDFITELGLQKSSAWLVPTHSILFSNGATIGEISITTYPVCTKQGILGIVPKQNIDVEYLYYFMSSSYFKKAVSRIVTEGTMKTAYLKDINNTLCPIPTKKEQQEIAKIPSALNSKIDTEKSILNLLITQKQHLLHQMFI